MIKNQLIVIVSHLPLNFVCDYEKQTIKILTKKNKVVVFNLSSGTSILRLLTNKQKRKVFQKQFKALINKKSNPILSFQSHQKPILWLFAPSLNEFIGKFKEKVCLYDCVDYYSSLDKKEDKKIKNQERDFLQKVGVVCTNSPTLYRLKKALHNKVFQVPQGCNVDLFLKTKKQSLPAEFKKIPFPRIIFIGNIDHRLNFPLIKKLAQNNPAWSFIFIGPLHKDLILAAKTQLEKNLSRLKKIKNIYFYPRCSKKKLVRFLDHSQLGFIPYDVRQEFCRYCYPMKVFEYFGRGKPVISTPIESLIPLTPYVQIAKDAKQFSLKIAKILKQGWPGKYQKKQKELAIANSWENKIEKMSQFLKL